MLGQRIENRTNYLFPSFPKAFIFWSYDEACDFPWLSRIAIEMQPAHHTLQCAILIESADQFVWIDGSQSLREAP